MGLVANIRYGKKVFDVKRLATLLEEGRMKRARISEDRQKTSFAPSSLGYQYHTCARKWVLAFKGGFFEEHADAIGVTLMDSGTNAHERIQEDFEAMGILQEKELELKTLDPPTRGFVDAIVAFDGETVVVEIKTTNEANFLTRKTSNTPTPYHRYQILVYMDGLGIDKGAILYENRNSGELLIIPIEMDDKNKEILEEAKSWMREVYSAYENKQLPTRAGRNKGGGICKGCPLANECWDNNGDGTIKISNMKVYKDA